MRARRLCRLACPVFARRGRPTGLGRSAPVAASPPTSPSHENTRSREPEGRRRQVGRRHPDRPLSGAPRQAGVGDR